MSIANYFNKLPKDAPLPIWWKLRLVVQQIFVWSVAVPCRNRTLFCCVFLLHYRVRSGSVVFVSWFSYRFCFFSYMRPLRRPYSLIHVVSSDDPRHWKETWLPLPSLTTNDVSAISQMCLQPYTSTVTGNDDRPLKFWSQLTRVTQQQEICFRRVTHNWKLATGLKCCILTQNQKGRIIRAPTAVT